VKTDQTPAPVQTKKSAALRSGLNHIDRMIDGEPAAGFADREKPPRIVARFAPR
jgi:hypothetical protein